MSEEKNPVVDKMNELLAPGGLLKVLSIGEINHRPHQYIVGPKHIAHAADHHGGMLGEETLKAVHCAYPGCTASYEEHVSDKVAFLQLQRDGKDEEANTELKKIVDLMAADKVDGFVMVETDEKYRITK